LEKLIVENKYDIKRFCIQFKDNWDNFNDDILLNAFTPTTKEEVPIMLTQLVKDQIALFAPLNKEAAWNKFGYKYFNPKDRAFFASIFKQNYLATDEKQTVECLTQIFN